MTQPRDTNQVDRTDHGSVMEHEYDGIQEYDNPMPRWWLLTFAGTVVFSIIYLFNVGPVGNGNGRIADYEAEVAAFKAKHPADSGTVTLASLTALLGNQEALAVGKETFARSCASCHRADAGGLIGPNLTDAYWLHGGALTEVHKTVTDGVPEKGMLAWKTILTPAQLNGVVAYVASLQGSNPANPKAPQGTLAVP